MTIGYFDTSAVIPLILAEPTSEVSRRLWTSVNRRASCVVVWPEAAAALAKAHRMGRIDNAGLETAVSNLDRIIEQIDLIVVTADSARRAAGLGIQLGLRGFDAVHVAASTQLPRDDIIGISGDRSMVDAWRRLGVATVDTSTTASRP